MSAMFSVPPEIIRWARDRSGRSDEYMFRHFPWLRDWESEAVRLSFGELQSFAKKTLTPIGNFFLPAPPKIDLGIPDFRTMRDELIREPSVDLIDTIEICQARQDWYREYAIRNRLDPVAAIGTISRSISVSAAAAQLRVYLRFDVEMRTGFSNLDDVYRYLSEMMDDLGILVMKSGIVGNNTHRSLDPEEFRGFAILDEYAPVIFVNGTDVTAANIFTLCHEFVHLGLGQSALTNFLTPEDTETLPEADQLERWCSQVGAEILVPREHLKKEFRIDADLEMETNRLSRVYRTSKYVVLHSLKDADLIEWEAFESAYLDLGDAWGRSKPSTSSGGDFYLTETVRVGRRFGTAIVADTLAGRTQHADAYRLLATPKHSTFERFAKHLGVG